MCGGGGLVVVLDAKAMQAVLVIQLDAKAVRAGDREWEEVMWHDATCAELASPIPHMAPLFTSEKYGQLRWKGEGGKGERKKERTEVNQCEAKGRRAGQYVGGHTTGRWANTKLKKR
jgi:hypothetical protein